MKFSILISLFVVILAIDISTGFPSQETKKTSSIVIDNGVTINGLDYIPEHPLRAFPFFERDTKCSGSCTCSGNKCSCSCSNCSNSLCLNGCIACVLG